MNWSDGPLLALDFETTGVDPWTARPITLALCSIHPGEDPLTVVSIMDAGVDIPTEAAEIHGWTTERLRAWGAESPSVVLPPLVDTIRKWMSESRPIVVFNARYDLTLLNAELVRIGEKPLAYAPVIDPLVIDHHLDRYRRGSRKLVALCEHYNVRLEGAHDAGFDAIAAARLAWRMGHDIPVLGEMDLDDLHSAQIQWARRDAESFKTYLAVTHGVIDRRVPIGWPVELSPDDDAELIERKPRPALPPNWDAGGYGGYE